MTSTNWDVAQDIGLIDRDIGFNIACVFYFATADGKESVVTHDINQISISVLP
jgi:hypothetical protein